MVSLMIILGITFQTGFSNDGFSSSDSTIHQQTVFLDTINGYINQWLYDSDISWEERLHRLDSMKNYCQNVFGETSPSTAYLLHKKGVLMHYKGMYGDPDAYLSAIEFYQQAIDQRMLLSDKVEYDMIKDVIQGYMNIGTCYRLINDPYNAYKYQLKGLMEADHYPKKDSIIALILKLNFQLARTYRDLGDYDQALKHYNNILYTPEDKCDFETQRKIVDLKMTTHLDLSGLFSIRLYLPKKALAHLNHAKFIMDSASLSNPADAADLYHKKGLSFNALGQYDSAISSYKSAISINSKRQNHALLAANYNNLSIVYIAKNMTPEASKSLIKAMEFYEKAGRQFDNAIVYENLSDISMLENRFAESIEYDNQSISHIVPDFEPRTLFDNPSIAKKAIPYKDLLLTTLGSKAFAFKELYKKANQTEYLKGAYETCLLADELINLMRMDYQAEASRMSLASFAKPIYEEGIETCYLLYQLQVHDSLLSKAFEFAEKSKAIVLLDAVRKTNARAHVDPKLMIAEKAMSLKVNYFERQAALFEQNTSNEASNDVYDSLLFYRRKRLELVDQIKEATPEYHNLIFNQETTSPVAVQQKLSKNQAFVQFFLGDSSSYTFAIQKDTTYFLKYDHVDSIKQWAHELVSTIKNKDQDFLKPSNKLYQALLEPLAEKNLLVKNITIVPDDILNLVNFEALVTKLPDEKRVYWPEFKNYLIYDHQISYAYSATTLEASILNGKSTNKKYLGVAPIMRSGFSWDQYWFDKLDYNKEEVIQTAGLFAGKSLVDESSLKAQFLELAPDHGLIHCATHAMANNLDGDLSFILFGHDSSDIVYAKDLYALDLNADLVVLSACETGVGELNRGEGVISLARSFTYAGAASVVTSLWNVKEKTSMDIIYQFYRGLKDGKPKSRALQEAKLKYLSEVSLETQMNAHPYYWAPLVVIGDPSSIQTGFPWKGIAALVLLLTFVITLYYRFRRRAIR